MGLKAFYGDLSTPRIFAIDVDSMTRIVNPDISINAAAYPVDKVTNKLLYAITRGERSVTPIDLATHRAGTFDLMFEGIRSALKGPIQQTINLAERNLENELDARLVKTLFLVKYVQEFKASVRNLCVLMLDHFDQDVSELKKRIEESLNRLVNQVYI